MPIHIAQHAGRLEVAPRQYRALMAGFFAIMGQWGVDNATARVILGAPAERTFFKWKAGEIGTVPTDTIRRIGYVGGIWKALEILYSNPIQADSWVKRPNEAFGRQGPAYAHGKLAGYHRPRGGAAVPRCSSRTVVLKGTTPMPSDPPIVRRIRWASATRVIASRYPPIDLFERVSSDAAVREALTAAEMLVNPRVRDEVGEIALVPSEDRVSGPGATWVMAPFTHRNPNGSRFSNGSYGVYYAGNTLGTSVAETAHHFARIARDSADGPRRETMRVLVGHVDAMLHDLDSLGATRQAELLNPDSYAAARPYASALRDAGSKGLHYRSVRHPSGYCLAAFRVYRCGHPATGASPGIRLGRPQGPAILRLPKRRLDRPSLTATATIGTVTTELRGRPPDCGHGLDHEPNSRPV